MPPTLLWLPALPWPPSPQAYNLANDLATRAQATWLYAKAKQNLLPLAQPAVDTGKGRVGRGGTGAGMGSGRAPD